MKRIKIIKIYENERYDYENTEATRTLADGIDWHDVSDEQFQEINQLISFANGRRYELKADYTLQLVEEIAPQTVELHLQLAKELYLKHQEQLRKQREKEEKTRLAREEKRKVTDLEKKRKQLERLQKELEDHK